MQGEEMKKAVILLGTIALIFSLAACSNILTYVRHDESKGNVQCSSDQALKRDSTCNASTK
jgi:outer membrane protein assembly factor BamE (lipoprotein component of BamABCDE complex)